MGDADATVLVASGDEQVREVLARVVEVAGLDAIRMDPSADVAEAAAAAPAQGVVLDLGAGNLEALRSLRASDDAVAAEARVIVLGTGPAGGRLAWQAGADGFLVRPFHARELQAALTDSLALDASERQARRDAGGAEHAAS